MNNKPDCHPEKPESGQQNKYQIASDISFLASRIIGKNGNAYCELFEHTNGATIKTIFFNGGTMKITIKYTPETPNYEHKPHLS